ncbi:Type II secretion system protein G precursor [Pirellulimonas nuda]|uniref:Type II secretion system protein G n=1 Tax=Pirellulimonas nuda TaxID=2528009 RepID=A0A518DIJ7_9BACT|nr:prepilin-type N-terminal cleavage/methylation domain-containing protein [Pirellulimonas nuda]QDU91242.1 Type II secretion system protein G precursor [Pirellulimonas nuda]
MRKPCPNRRAGFSLMELLLVVVILGIIAAIVVPRVSVSMATAEQKVRAHQMTTMNAAIERYQVETGSWPAALTDLTPAYLPDGVPVPPGGGAYSLDGTTYRSVYTP